MNDNGNRPRNLTFSQRNGYEPLPKPMRLEELSEDLRRKIWNQIWRLFMSKSEVGHGGQGGYYHYFSLEVESSVERISGRLHNVSEDRIDTSHKKVMRDLRDTVEEGSFNKVLDLVELISDENLDKDFPDSIAHTFETQAAPYRFDISLKPYQFFPCSTKSQGDATRDALETIRENGMKGAETHLRDAAKHINDRQYADSIADSIHAVEFVAHTVDPKSSKKFGNALDSLEKKGILKNKALKGALKKLYGYTNTEEGIRHSLRKQDTANVGLDEAMLMFGACASFAAYLTQKHEKIGK